MINHVEISVNIRNVAIEMLMNDVTLVRGLGFEKIDILFENVDDSASAFIRIDRLGECKKIRNDIVQPVRYQTFNSQ